MLPLKSYLVRVFPLQMLPRKLPLHVSRVYSSFAVNKWTRNNNQQVGGNSLLSRVPPLHDQRRDYWGNEGRIGFRRKRSKQMRAREAIVEPSSPVIDYLVPWPKDDMELLPPDLYKPDIETLTPEEELKAKNDILQRINDQVKDKSEGRLFAVVQIAGKQFKVTPEDIIIVQENFLPTVGDTIRLHKVLMVGSKDFTLVGCPLLQNELVRVEATAIEKTLSYTKMVFKMIKRERYRRTSFYKSPYTMLRINLVEIRDPLEKMASNLSSLDLNASEESSKI